MVNIYAQKSIRAFLKCLPVLPQTYNLSCLPLFPMLPHSDIKWILQAHQSAISLLPLTQTLENFVVDFQHDDIHRLSLVVFKLGFLTFMLDLVLPPMLCIFQFPSNLYITLYGIGWSLIPVGKLVIPIIRTFKSVLCGMEEQSWFWKVEWCIFGEFLWNWGEGFWGRYLVQIGGAQVLVALICMLILELTKLFEA